MIVCAQKNSQGQNVLGRMGVSMVKRIEPGSPTDDENLATVEKQSHNHMHHDDRHDRSSAIAIALASSSSIVNDGNINITGERLEFENEFAHDGDVNLDEREGVKMTGVKQQDKKDTHAISDADLDNYDHESEGKFKFRGYV